MKTKKSTPTISDVAQLAGVSTATVSRVLNGIEVVSAETVQRVQDAIAELHYIPSTAARVLASRKTNTIGLLVPEISGAFFQSMLRGIEKGASDAGYDLLINTTHTPYSKDKRRRPLAEHNTDGLLVFTGSLDKEELTRLSHNHFPLVLLYQTSPEGLDLPMVTIENQNGARLIVEHLIQVHGCRRILYLQGPPDHEDSIWRERGYREALAVHGVPFDPGLISQGGFNRNEAQAAMEAIFRTDLVFDAVFTGDDDAAIGVLQALRAAGRQVPGDVAVAGFDDQVFASALSPSLTTVRAQTEQVGLKAVHQLIRIINGETVEARVVLGTELVIRNSCGCQMP